MEAIWQANKKCYLPLLSQENHLQFALYQPNDELSTNQFGIPEPLAAAEKISAEQLDLVIMPLVAFDFFGHRLGTGGGYYDRTFAFKQNTETSKPFLLGFAYAAQQALLLPFEQWDVLLDGVVTEKEFIVCEKK
jgi:5-formyltetrahydrofolate cyclo-ligase